MLYLGFLIELWLTQVWATWALELNDRDWGLSLRQMSSSILVVTSESQLAGRIMWLSFSFRFLLVRFFLFENSTDYSFLLIAHEYLGQLSPAIAFFPPMLLSTVCLLGTSPGEVNFDFLHQRHQSDPPVSWTHILGRVSISSSWSNFPTIVSFNSVTDAASIDPNFRSSLSLSPADFPPFFPASSHSGAS